MICFTSNDHLRHNICFCIYFIAWDINTIYHRYFFMFAPKCYFVCIFYLRTENFIITFSSPPRNPSFKFLKIQNDLRFCSVFYNPVSTNGFIPCARVCMKSMHCFAPGSILVLAIHVPHPSGHSCNPLSSMQLSG